MTKEEPEVRILTRRITRRQAVKAGGIAALGLAFSKPIISSLHPPSALAQVITPGPTLTQPCTAAFTSVTISGPSSIVTALAAGETVSATYTAVVSPDCGACNEGNCDPLTEYKWESPDAASGDVVITDPIASSTLVTFKVFGNYTLELTVTLTCGAGNCEAIAVSAIEKNIEVRAD